MNDEIKEEAVPETINTEEEKIEIIPDGEAISIEEDAGGFEEEEE